MEEKEPVIREYVLLMIETEQRGMSFQQLYTALVDSGIISHTRDNQKLVVSIIRGLDVNGHKAAHVICPLRSKTKEQH